jgi:hypothetical protein
MGSLERRLEALEEERGLARSEPRSEASEERRKRAWLATAKLRRRDETRNREEILADGLLRLFRSRGELEHMTTEEARGRLLAWRPRVDARAIERVLAGAIYRQEEGTENMVCPPEWREALEAAEELREKHAAIPDEVLARWAIVGRDVQEEEEEGGSDLEEDLEEYGITDELAMRAIGPDAEEIPDEERERRLVEILAESYYGEQGWRVQQEIYRLMEERSSNG